MRSRARAFGLGWEDHPGRTAKGNIRSFRLWSSCPQLHTNYQALRRPRQTMTPISLRQTRREPKDSRNGANAGCTRLAGSPSRNSIRSRSHPPANFHHARKKFGQRIQALRQRFGLSQQRLGMDCGITAPKIKRIESGLAEPDLLLIIRFSDRFGIAIDRLLRGIK